MAEDYCAERYLLDLCKTSSEICSPVDVSQVLTTSQQGEVQASFIHQATTPRVAVQTNGDKGLSGNLSSTGREIIHNLTTDTMADENFPEVRGGGSLILAWQIRSKRVLVVGGGEVGFAWTPTLCHC